jgi:hypothetical protein
MFPAHKIHFHTNIAARAAAPIILILVFLPPNVLAFHMFLASLLSPNKIQYTSVAEQSQIE